MSLINRHFRNFLKRRAAFQIRGQHSQIRPLQVPKYETDNLMFPVFKNVKLFAQNVALRDELRRYTYANLFLSAKELSQEISKNVEGKMNERVMFMCPNDASYVVTLWAIWMSGQIAVPLSPLHPQNILLYYANDTNAKLLVTTPQYVDLMQRISKNTHAKLYVLDEKLTENCATKETSPGEDFEIPQPENFYEQSNGLILYTSGTTGNPKGVVLSHKNLNFQVSCLINAWKWTPNDVILHTLPLHHVHGTVNALLCPLHIGAKTVMLPKFDTNAVWCNLLGVNAKPNDYRISVFMAVPTIYFKLISHYQKVFAGDPKIVEHIKNTLKNKIRLMVSGSAPLTQPVFDKWLQISGHRLLERYGMTEIGMALSNSYEDPAREPGYVGMPLPGVSVRIAEKTNNGYETKLEAKNINGDISVKIHRDSQGEVTGEILVKSGAVFKEYFGRPEATKKEFTEDGWFTTGDVGQYLPEKRKIKILGRTSVDIIKSGGYKISALQVETQLLAHPDIVDCAVVGLPDKQWGERVMAILVVREGKSITLEGLKEWAGDKMPKYTIPTVLKEVEEIPKNAMGKVNKKELLKTLLAE